MMQAALVRGPGALIGSANLVKQVVFRSRYFRSPQRLVQLFLICPRRRFRHHLQVLCRRWTWLDPTVSPGRTSCACHFGDWIEFCSFGYNAVLSRPSRNRDGFHLNRNVPDADRLSPGLDARSLRPMIYLNPFSYSSGCIKMFFSLVNSNTHTRGPLCFSSHC